MDLQLWLSKVYNALLKKSNIKNNKKSYESWLSKGYINSPEVSFIIQSHNKSIQVKHIVRKLRQWPGAEIIVIDDGSDQNHTRALAKYLQGANEFIIRANDLYENVMYDKAIRFANGQYLALMQDDDDFNDLLWVSKAVDLMKTTPDLAILGGKDGLDFLVDHEKRIGKDLPFVGSDKVDFEFVAHVDRAPMWLNKSMFEEKLKHIDFEFAPFQYDDCELCLRTWLSGLRVGWYNAGFSSLSAGGMRVWNSKFTVTQCERNGHKLYEMYKDKKAKIDELVAEARVNKL